MTLTIVLLILLFITLLSLKLVVLFKLIDFAFNRWIKPYTAPAGRGRSRAEMILRERYASAEIDEAEMRRRLAVLSAGHVHP